MSYLSIFMLIGTLLAAGFSLAVVRNTRPQDVTSDVAVEQAAQDGLVDVQLESSRAAAQTAIEAAQVAIATVEASPEPVGATDMQTAAAMLRMARRKTGDFRGVYKRAVAGSHWPARYDQSAVQLLMMQLDGELRVFDRKAKALKAAPASTLLRFADQGGVQGRMVARQVTDLERSLKTAVDLLAKFGTTGSDAPVR